MSSCTPTSCMADKLPADGGGDDDADRAPTAKYYRSEVRRPFGCDRARRRSIRNCPGDVAGAEGGEAELGVKTRQRLVTRQQYELPAQRIRERPHHHPS